MRGPHPDPLCCCTQWQFSFHEAFSPARQLLLRSDGDSLVGLAGYVHAEVGPVLEPIESHWRFGCPLLGSDAVALLTETLEEELFARMRPLLMLSGITYRSDLWNAVITTFGRKYGIHMTPPAIFRSARLEGGLDGYLSRRSANHRHKLRQAIKRAHDAGITFERHCPTTAAEVDVAYERVLAVEATSWKGIGECGMAQPPSRDFYRLMLRRLAASGAGRIIFAQLQHRDIGFVFGGVVAAHYRGQQFSYAHDQRHRSIGNLLQFEQIRWLCEEGVEWYDMGPLMDYKVHWAEVESRTETLVLRP